MNRIMSTVILWVGLISLAPINSVLCAQNLSPLGTWQTIDDVTHKPRSIVSITEHNGVISGTILKVLNKQPDDTGFCKKCPGRFKDKPIVGLQFMWGLKQSGQNVWSGGQILDPKIGKIYQVKMSVSDNGKQLQVRGFIGFSFLGRTQVWYRQ